MFANLLNLGMLSASLMLAAELPTNENGAVNLYVNSGWSFGLPAVRAAATASGVGSAISPEKKSLPAFGIGATVRVWKFVAPFVDLTVIDTGKAFAQVGSLRSEVQADTYDFHGGVRLIGAKGRIRPYAQFGGGVLNQSVKGNFINAGQSTPVSASGSATSLTYGGGVQFFLGRKWGSSFGFDGFHVTKPLIGAGQNYSKVHFGVFYQTKSSIE